MKMKLIATVLLLATLFGCFGCVAIGAPEASEVEDLQPNFIGSSKMLSDGVQKPENFLNLAAKDEKGNVKYQIVYPFGAADWLVTECKNLADEIFAVTGVMLPVVNGMEKAKDCEILVGDVARSEVIDIKDRFALKGEQMLIKVVDQRLMIFSRDSLALSSAISYFRSISVYSNKDTKEYGVASDYE